MELRGLREHAVEVEQGGADAVRKPEHYDDVGTMRPSDGCTSTHPCPENPSWKLSPEPSPISDFACTSARRFVVTPPDQAIAADGSANVGASADVEPQRLAVGDERDHAGAVQARR